MKVSITSPREDELVIYRRPNYWFSFLGVSAAVIFVWWNLSEKSLFVIVAFILLIITVVDLLTQNEITCKINKTTQEVAYKRKDILGDHLGFQELQFPISEARQLEMHRYVRRGGDSFQIQLGLLTSESLPLTGKDLSFSECQDYTEQIRMFLGPDIPVVAMD